MNYFFNSDTQGDINASIKAVNGWQVTRSGLEGVLPWKTPGGKFGRAAISATGDVITNALHLGSKYSDKQALIDFGLGFIGDLAGGQLSELVNKYGSRAVAKGLEMMNIPDSTIQKITGISLKKTI